VEKAVAVAPVNVAIDALCAASSTKTAKSAHTAADPAGEGVNHDGASEFRRKLNEEVEDHSATMALMGQSG
jgi:hypothetical protein